MVLNDVTNKLKELHEFSTLKINAEFFKEFVKTHFAATFERSCNPKKKMFLQSGDPSQNIKKGENQYNHPSSNGNKQQCRKNSSKWRFVPKRLE